MYNNKCLDKQNIRAFCIFNSAITAIKYCGQSALHDRIHVLAVCLSNGSNHGGHFIMIKKKRGVYNKVENICENCGESFYTYKSARRKYCSRECYLSVHTKNKLVPRVCRNCGKKFLAYKTDVENRNAGIYCSRKCQVEFHATPTVINNCLNCGKEIVTTEARISQDRDIFCCKECANKYKVEHSGVYKMCIVCGSLFRVVPSLMNEQYTCSKRCGKTAHRNPQWQGGHTIVYGKKWTRSLRNEIRMRDGYKCAICGDKGIDVHHIDYDKFNNNKDNLITLCHSCHSKTNTNREYWQAYFTNDMTDAGLY